MTLPRTGTIAFAIHGPLARGDLPDLCDRLIRVLVFSGAVVALCDVSALEADVVAIDALAQLQLTARRLGCRITLWHASAELLDLLAFAGLAEALGVEAGREAEEREDPLGVEEEG